jgi:hypothetical protein
MPLTKVILPFAPATVSLAVVIVTDKPPPKPKLDRAVAASDAPVPPLATAKVPARTTLPAVGVLGVKPVVPALNDCTPTGAVFVTITLPVADDTLMPVPAMIDNTPVLAMLTLPVALDTPIPVPAMLDNTPVLAMLIEPGPLVTPIPVPGVKVFLVSVSPVLLPISSCPLV